MKIELNDYGSGGFGIWLMPETIEDAKKLNNMVRKSKNRIELTIFDDFTVSVNIRRNRLKGSSFSKTIGNGK